MKKLLIGALILASFIIPGSVLAENSTPKTADSLVFIGEGRFMGIILATDATNPVTVAVYDNNIASTTGGRKMTPSMIFTTSATSRLAGVGYNYNDNVYFHKGLYIDITCSGTTEYVVTFEKGID